MKDAVFSTKNRTDLITTDIETVLYRYLATSCRTLGWHWQAAPFLAIFDLLTLLKPISKDDFIQYMAQIDADPFGPFGKVLLNAPHFSKQNELTPVCGQCAMWRGIEMKNAD